VNDEKIVPVTPATEFQESDNQRFLSHRILLVCVLILAFLGFRTHQLGLQEEEDVKFEARVEKIDASIPRMLFLFRHQQEASVKNETFPNLLWRGDFSELIHWSKRMEVASSPSGKKLPVAVWEVLAKTENGRYFLLTYRLENAQDCSEEWVLQSGSCARLKSFSSLSTTAAKAHIYRLGDAALYEKTFQEPMPPAEVPA
jgi:hypothetical protein